ncbi:hypothetical protein K8R33_02740 [archaeon]|nr:hypothetical protein [archaeon]
MKKKYQVTKYYEGNKKVTKFQGILFMIVGFILFVGVFYGIYQYVYVEGKDRFGDDGYEYYSSDEPLPENVEYACEYYCYDASGEYYAVERNSGEQFKCECLDSNENVVKKDSFNITQIDEMAQKFKTFIEKMENIPSTVEDECNEYCFYGDVIGSTYFSIEYYTNKEKYVCYCTDLGGFSTGAKEL